MDTEKDLLVKIMQVTRKIQDNHPELSKFLSEMPETISSDDNQEINTASLKNYLESLNELLGKAGTKKNQI